MAQHRLPLNVVVTWEVWVWAKVVREDRGAKDGMAVLSAGGAWWVRRCQVENVSYVVCKQKQKR